MRLVSCRGKRAGQQRAATEKRFGYVFCNTTNTFAGSVSLASWQRKLSRRTISRTLLKGEVIAENVLSVRGGKRKISANGVPWGSLGYHVAKVSQLVSIRGPGVIYRVKTAFLDLVG